MNKSSEKNFESKSLRGIMKKISNKRFSPKFNWTTIIFLLIALSTFFKGELNNFNNEIQNQELDYSVRELDKKIDILGENERNWFSEAINVTNFDEFIKVEDIRISKDNIMTIGWADKAYFLSKKTVSQHAIIETSFTPYSEVGNYYIIVENSFALIIGDGDRQSVKLKSFSPINTNWDEPVPKNCFISRPPKCFLKNEFPIGEDIIVKVDIDARIIDLNKRKVNLEIKFFTQEGMPYDSLTDGSLYWEFEVENKFNERARYGIGIIDPEARKPKLKFNYLVVREKTQ